MRSLRCEAPLYDKGPIVMLGWQLFLASNPVGRMSLLATSVVLGSSEPCLVAEQRWPWKHALLVSRGGREKPLPSQNWYFLECFLKDTGTGFPRNLFALGYMARVYSARILV